MILLEYHSTGGYRLLYPKTNQFIISRDVVIYEVREWDWSEKEKGSVSMQLDFTDTLVNDPVPISVAAEVRRSQRERKTPQRLQDYELVTDSAVNAEDDLVHFALFAENEPIDFTEAMQDVKWIKAMEDELRSIEKN